MSNDVPTNAPSAPPLELRPGLRVHLVGIGGAGLSAIARVLLGRGLRVSGSDMAESPFTADLRALGAELFIGHDAAQVGDAELVVVSSAVPADNVEQLAARARGIPVLKRDAMLGLLMAGRTGIAVAGTHGKTTTTGLIAQILIDDGRDPTVVVGGLLPGLGANGRAGSGDLFVVEADEYDHMFLGLRPSVAVINNIEHDHPDIFADAASYLAAFHAFAHLLPPDGRLVACADDPAARQLATDLPHPERVITFGLSAGAQWRGEELRPNQLGGSDFVVSWQGKTLGLARLRIPGEHNVRNALAAIAVTSDLGVGFGRIVQTLADFGGVARRFEEIGTVGDVVIIDDYAHHPTEIRATLSAARRRYPGRRLWAVWQPHTYSRTRLLLDEFAGSFETADRVIVLDIYRSRERDTLGLDAPQVTARMQSHPYVRYVGALRAAADYILDRVRPGDVVLTLGAGDGNRVGEMVLDGLQERLGLSGGGQR